MNVSRPVSSSLLLLTSLILANCSPSTTTTTESEKKIEVAPSAATSQATNQQQLDQKLFDIVGESVLTTVPDDAVAAMSAINAGANVNARNKLSDSPLLIAARNGRFNVLKVLLDKGADINAQDNHGDTALMRAVTNATSGDETTNDLKAVTLLLARGADVNLRDKNGFTALSGSELPGGDSNPNYRAVRQMLKKAGAK